MDTSRITNSEANELAYLESRGFGRDSIRVENCEGPVSWDTAHKVYRQSRFQKRPTAKVFVQDVQFILNEAIRQGLVKPV